MVQYQGVQDHDVEQFRKAGKAVVVAPDKFKTGSFIHPFAKARA